MLDTGIANKAFKPVMGKLTLKKAQELMDANDGNLCIRGMSDITELPENLIVEGDLDLSGTGITFLPDNLTVKGHLNIEGTKIRILPSDLSVGGNLYLDVRWDNILRTLSK